MAKYYEFYRVLILAAALAGVYFPSIEKIYGNKWRIKLLRIFCIIPWVALPLYCTSLIKYTIFDVDDLESKIYGEAMLLIVSFFTFSYFSFCYYKSEFVRIFELWDSMFQEELYSEERQVLLTKNRKQTHRWLGVYGGLSVVGVSGYITSVYAQEEKVLNHPSGIPYKHQSPDFELLNTLDLLTCIYGLAVVVVFDSMTMTFLSMEEAQLRHLKISLGKIVDILSVTDAGNIIIKSEEVDSSLLDVWKMKDAFDEVDRRMGIWVSHHQQVIRFHMELQKVLQVPLAIKFSVFVLMICLIGFLSLTGRFTIVEVVFSSVICVVSYGVFYSNIMYADTIAEAGESIFDEAFGKSYYMYPDNLRTVFFMIQLNSYRPVQYTAFKIYSLSSRTFVKILSSAYSIFTFMIQTNRKKIKSLEPRRTSRRV